MSEQAPKPHGHAKMRIETLAAGFALFEQTAMPGLNAHGRAQVRAVFYAGAQTLMDIIEIVGRDPEQRRQIAKTLLAELQRFADEVTETKTEDHR
jgi:hypothetical protein